MTHLAMLFTQVGEARFCTDRVKLWLLASGQRLLPAREGVRFISDEFNEYWIECWLTPIKKSCPDEEARKALNIGDLFRLVSDDTAWETFLSALALACQPLPDRHSFEAFAGEQARAIHRLMDPSSSRDSALGSAEGPSPVQQQPDVGAACDAADASEFETRYPSAFAALKTLKDEDPRHYSIWVLTFTTVVPHARKAATNRTYQTRQKAAQELGVEDKNTLTRNLSLFAERLGVALVDVAKIGRQRWVLTDAGEALAKWFDASSGD